MFDVDWSHYGDSSIIGSQCLLSRDQQVRVVQNYLFRLTIPVAE